MKDVEPSQPAEYILKGVVNATIGQEQNSVWNHSFKILKILKVNILARTFESSTTVFSISWWISEWMRHNCWTSMHGIVLLSFKTIWRRFSISQFN